MKTVALQALTSLFSYKRNTYYPPSPSVSMKSSREGLSAKGQATSPLPRQTQIPPLRQVSLGNPCGSIGQSCWEGSVQGANTKL